MILNGGSFTPPPPHTHISQKEIVFHQYRCQDEIHTYYINANTWLMILTDINIAKISLLIPILQKHC